MNPGGWFAGLKFQDDLLVRVQLQVYCTFSAVSKDCVGYRWDLILTMDREIFQEDLPALYWSVVAELTRPLLWKLVVDILQDLEILTLTPAAVLLKAPLLCDGLPHFSSRDGWSSSTII